jgi:hypothetical protein
MIVHGGSCALATGKATSEKAIANNRNKEIAVAVVLHLENFKYFFLL